MLNVMVLGYTARPCLPVCDGEEVHQVNELIIQMHPEGIRIKRQLPGSLVDNVPQD